MRSIKRYSPSHMITYQNIYDLSSKESAAMIDRFSKDQATTITVVIERDGEITVLSPCSAELTQHNLLTVGMHLPVHMAMN